MVAPDPKGVFINAPFDPGYEPLFITLVGTLVFLGQEPHCVLEIRERGDGRLARIIALMRACQMSIHDLSRVGKPSRFNMPFELGLACAIKDDKPTKYEVFVLDSKPYRIDRTPLDSRFPPNDPKPSDEPLDFTVERDGSCVGIEVTDFMLGDRKSGSLLEAYQNFTSRLAAETETAYRALTTAPVFASVSFTRDLRCKHSGIGSFARAVATEIANVAPTISPDGSTTIHRDGRNLPQGVDYVIIKRVVGFNKIHVGVVYTAWAEELLPLHIDEVIESKDPNLSAYRRKCPEIWLLIVVNGFRLSGFVEPSTGLSSAAFQTGFDRVLLLHDFSRLIELKSGA